MESKHTTVEQNFVNYKETSDRGSRWVRVCLGTAAQQEAAAGMGSILSVRYSNRLVQQSTFAQCILKLAN